MEDIKCRISLESESSAHQLKESPDKKRKEYNDVGVKICCEVEKEG